MWKKSRFAREGTIVQYFLETEESIAEGVTGFTHYGALHIVWLILTAVFFAGMCIWYRRCGQGGRKKLRHVLAYSLLGNELFKTVCLLLGGNWLPKYLPLHMCSINIFLIAWHAFRPGKFLGNYLYAVGIPTAVIAIIFPSWTALPLGNFMHLHSFTVHMCLAVYPLMVTLGGDIQPHPRYLLRCLGFAVAMAVPVYGINLLLDTNFMFLMYAKPGNPLYLFEQMMGNHLWGIPILSLALLVLMYLLALPAWRKKAR